MDIIATSAFNDWSDPGAMSLVCFENDGTQSFIRRDLAPTPSHLIVVDGADMNGDGRIELVTGGLHFYPPYDRVSRVTIWEQ